MTTLDCVISIVGPVHNEEHSLPEFHRRLLAALRALGLPFEVIYVDDGSRDRSPKLLAEFLVQDAEVRVLELSRNFGHQAAITAGMDHARGQACIIMDTDGQDPPELIGQLVEEWRRGSSIVYAVRTRRDKEGLFKRFTAALFYRLMRRITRVEIPLDAGDFRLLDRKVLAIMHHLRETHRFIRGLTCWTGFRQSFVPYERKARLGGRTHYTLWKMLHLATDGITSFSHEPLRWVTYFGLASFAVSALIGIWVLYVRIFNAQTVRGWTSMMVLVLFLGAIQLISLGVMGEYLGRIFDEVKRRPLYVISEAHGFEPAGILKDD
jgi:dolichol-phosphate mannosyltransferase